MYDSSSHYSSPKGLCPSGFLNSSYGCVAESSESKIFISTDKLFWVNSGAQLIILSAGVLDFVLGTLYFYLRRRRTEQRLQRSREARQPLRINEDGAVLCRDATHHRFFSQSQQPSKPLKPVSELNGCCCGCGEVADTVLLPCKHAVCCISCSANARYCPFCKETVSDRQRLFPV